MKEHNSCH